MCTIVCMLSGRSMQLPICHGLGHSVRPAGQSGHEVFGKPRLDEQDPRYPLFLDPSAWSGLNRSWTAKRLLDPRCSSCALGTVLNTKGERSAR